MNDVYNYYEKNITTLTDTNRDELTKYSSYMEIKLIKIIIDEAIQANAKTWNYINTILKDCYDTKIFTVEQFKIRQQRYKQEKSRDSTSKQKTNSYKNHDQRDYTDLDSGQFYANKK